MDVWNYKGFSKILDSELWEYIQKNNVPVKHKEDDHIASIELYSSNPHWTAIEAILKRTGKSWLSDTIFTKEELQSAPWLRVRTTWRTGYPQPMDAYEYETITYSRNNYCTECGIGLEQIDAFRIKKVPSWGRRHFFSLFWVEDELFVSETVKKAFKDNGITGVSFVPVKDRTGNNELEGIFQFQILNILDEGLIDDPRNLRSSVLCSKCGRRKSMSNEGIMVQFKHHVFRDVPDVVKTGDYFGVAGNKSPAREIIINQKTYQTIVKNQLEKMLANI